MLLLLFADGDLCNKSKSKYRIETISDYNCIVQLHTDQPWGAEVTAEDWCNNY